MDFATTMSVVQTLLTMLQCFQLKDFCSKKSLSSQINLLEDTFIRIKGVLLDAESKQALSNQEESYLEELKDALYEADDLFDEFLTLSHRNKLSDCFKHRLLSLFTKFKNDYKISQKVDNIKQKLDHIASRNQVAIAHNPQPIKMRSRETCSYVHAVNIIGREDDLEKIVGTLLQSDGKQPVSFLSIVGIGGLGKTALAQLVFNHPRITSAFPLKLWICVSDQDHNKFDEKEILRKILEAATGHNHHDATKDRLQSQLRQLLKGKKYLIVLDDVWTENREQWSSLVDFLVGDQTRSWILVTTRSRITAQIIGDGSMHELKGLSKENSWRLFVMVAFGSNLSNPCEDLVKIGQKIVQRCANVPLAIKVAGSLLYGQDKQTWLACQELPLTKSEGNNGIMPILKLSYSQLEPPLKSCFGYCALLPKDFEIKKKKLIRVWMAQGYIPSDDQRSMEVVAEGYFSVLLRRCFFQDVKDDKYGGIYSCKIHDLMHDIAQEVVGNEICMGEAIVDNVNKKVRHFSSTRRDYFRCTFNKTSIRSFIQVTKFYGFIDRVSLESLLANWKYLRVLNLHNLSVKSLPSTIGKLIHLRYLDLSCNDNLEMLPRQITKLYNLETLDLHYCLSLKELPKDMSKLVNLRALDLRFCRGLSFMPRRMQNLTCLQELSMFVIGEANLSPHTLSSGLEDLKVLTNLKGDLEIKIGTWKKDKNEERGGREVGCLSNKPHLTSIKLEFNEEEYEGRVENDEGIIEELQPHSNLMELKIWYYKGVRMPKWASEDTFANLRHIIFVNCPNIQSLDFLCTLHHLNSIQLETMKNLEWLIEKKNGREGIGESSVRLRKEEQECSFFPSLEFLCLAYLPKLKGWRRGEGMGDNHQLLYLCFPKLKHLTLFGCPNLTVTVDCPELEHLFLSNFNKNLEINSKIEKITKGEEKQKEKLREGTTFYIPKVWIFSIDNLRWLNSQHIDIEAFQCLQTLEISNDEEVESLGEVRDVFYSCSSSLLYLVICNCSNLRSVFGGLEHLTTLEKLEICNCPKLSLSEEEENVDVNNNGNGSGGSSSSGTQWQSLRTMSLGNLPLLTNLPSWMQFMTALQTLHICYCENLKSLPNWMPKLTSLRELRFVKCAARLKERCEQSTGEDWSHIQHITVTFNDW